MEKDFVFRSSVFGGYKKQDVMGYLSELNAEKAALQQQYAVVSHDAVSFSKRVSELETQTATLSAVTAQLEGERLKAAQLERDSAAMQTENELLRTRINLLESEKARLTADCEKLRAVEAQLGAAMLDARVYSEKMMTDAGEKAATVNKDTGEAISRAASRVGALSGNLGEIAGVFNKALSELEERVRLLVGDMEKAAAELLGTRPQLQPQAQAPAAPLAPEVQTPVAGTSDGKPENGDSAVYLFGYV